MILTKKDLTLLKEIYALVVDAQADGPEWPRITRGKLIEIQKKLEAVFPKLKEPTHG